MLSLMRKHAGSWMIKVVLGAIVVTFVFWGGYQFTSQRLSRIARVNGDWITVDEYRATYNQLLGQVRQTFGDNLNDELLQSLGLRKRAMDQLIDQALMLQKAEELNLRVTDEELVQSIRSMAVFQSAGRFDVDRYRRVLQQNNLTAETFQTSQRDALLIGKLQAFITGSVKVSDQEALEWYRWENAEVSINYVLVEAKQFTDLEPGAEELAAFFEQNKDFYKTDPTVKVRYLVFKPEAYKSRVNISEDEIRDYYETYAEKFKTPKTVEARHILVKVASDAAEEKVAEAKAKIEDVLKLAREGQDFSELATQYSEGPSRDKGGYLGKFEKKSMVKPFADKAFSMQPGEISDPVRTRFGWHIIKVEDVNPASATSFDDARDQIQKKLLDEKSKLFALDDAEAAYDESYEGDDLNTIAARRNLSVVVTDHFSQKDAVKGIKNDKQFAAAAFSLAENEISDIQDFGDGYYLIEVIERISSAIPEFDTVKEKVRKDWIKKEQNELARTSANDLLKELKNGLELDEVAPKFGLEPKHTPFFKRDASIADIGYEPEINQVAFSLSGTNPLPDEAIGSQKGFYVISFRERKAPPADQFDSQKAQIKERLLQQKRFRTFDAWLLDIKRTADISIEDDFQEI